MQGPSSIRTRFQDFLQLFIVAAGYFILARVSLFLSYQHSNASPVWPPSGFAFAMILILGYRIVPGILVGAFAANLVAFQFDHDANLSTAVWVSLIISIGNAGEAVTGYYLLKKILPGIKYNDYFQKANHVFYFFMVSLIMCMVSSVVGTTGIVLGDFVNPEQKYTAWLTWWLGDVSGILLTTPFILIWIFFFRTKPKFSFTRIKVLETAVLFFLVILVSGIVFNNWFLTPFMFQWSFWIIPVIVWAAVRFEQHLTITALVLCSSIAIWGVLGRNGPFYYSNDGIPSELAVNQSLLVTQAFISIIVVTILILNASVIERNKAEAVLRDMSNQLEKRVNERTAELEERSNFIETIFDSVVDLIVVVDKDCNYLSVNKKVEEIYNLNRKDIIGESIFKIFPKLGETEIYTNLQKAFAGESVHELAYRSPVSNRWFENFYIPLKNNKHEIYGVLIIGHDNTAVMEASEKIRELAEEHIVYNKQLEQTNKELESFTFIASHDLQEPLRKIRTFLNFIAEREMHVISDTSKNYLNRTVNAAGQMQQLIDDLLAYSRTTGSEEHFQKTDMNAVLEKVKVELKETIDEKKARIESAKLPELNVIPFQMEQLFTNLINNSLKFSTKDASPQIIIRAEIVDGKTMGHTNADPRKRYHHLSFADNGIGFDAKYNEKVFDLFQRLHSRQDYSGTGIGLAICKKIIDNHKGFIDARGETDKGTVFNIYLLQ